MDETVGNERCAAVSMPQPANESHGLFPHFLGLFRQIDRETRRISHDMPEASIITQGQCPRRFPGVSIRRIGFIGFSPAAVPGAPELVVATARGPV